MYQQQIDNFLKVITQPHIYNDSRDQIIGNFNKVQAFWGYGKAFHDRCQPPFDLNESYPTQKFKAIRLQLISMQLASEKDIENYLNKVPDGFDPKLWEEAKQNNPDPRIFVPMPMVGFQALNERFKMQQFEVQQQKSRLGHLSAQVSEMQKHVAAMKSKIEEYRRNRIVLGNRVLKVMIMKEIEHRKGLPIQADEERLRSRMENILSELHAQTKYKGCLNELMSQLKQTQIQQHRASSIQLDETVIEDIKTHLKNEHSGIQHLIEVIKQDNQILAKSNNANNHTPMTS